MNRTTRRPPRTKSAASSVKERIAAGLSSPAPFSADVSDDDTGAVSARLMSELSRAFDQDDALDHDEKRLLTAAFEKALDDAASQTNVIHAPDRDEWVALVNDLRGSGSIGTEDANSLIRHLDQALAPLNDKAVSKALELSRRISDDGESSALAWLASQEPADEADEVGIAETNPFVRKNLTTSSKSRRLRGPPRV